MLIRMCRKNRNKSLYKCDRCGRECKLQECKGIYVTNEFGRPVKQWDLCLKCYEALKRGIVRSGK